MTVFEDNYKKLNEKQREAVDEIYGPVMVLAGPGTGKTQVIAMRIANILKKTDTRAFNILCLTFTNSGARAMRERLVKIMGVDGYKVVIHTFHSFCSEVISMYPERFLFAKRIQQITDLEQINYLKQVLDANNDLKLIKPLKSPYHYLMAIKANISTLKREGFDPVGYGKIVDQEIAKFGDDESYYHQKGRYKGKMIGKYASELKKLEKNKEMANVYDSYQKKLVDEGKFDFDDMILSVIKEFEEDRNFLADFQERFLFVLIDEYQDTNGAQNKLIELMALDVEKPNIFTVGDDDQSIYRFQGASLENLIFFRQKFTDSRIITLRECYRCNASIMNGARSMIEKSNKDAGLFLNIKKDFLPVNQDTNKISLVELENGQAELFFMASKIAEIQKENKDLNDIAVFYRNNNEVSELVDVLDRFGINWRMIKGGNTLDSVDVLHLINLLKYLQNPRDDVLLFKVLHYDFLGMDTLDVMRLLSRREKGQKLWEYITENLASSDLMAKNEWNNFDRLMWWQKFVIDMQKSQYDEPYISYLERVINESGLIKYIDASEERFERLTDLKSFFDFVKSRNNVDKEFDTQKLVMDIEEMEENKIAMRRDNLDFDGQAVNLMTAHSSKGLEFEYVFIYRCIDGHWSNKKTRDVLPLIEAILTSDSDEEVIDEERRLFYVAMTRAKNHLFLTWAKKYTDNENAKETNKSMFVEEIDEQWTQKIDAGQYELNMIVWLEKYFGGKESKVFKFDTDFVKQLLLDFRLSPTGLNKYLKCPRKFFYEDILRVPRAKTAILSFGTAVHAALENFYIDFKKSGELPQLDALLSYYEQAVEREIFTKAERSQYLQDGKSILAKYFERYDQEMKKPLFNEYNFARSQVMLDDEIVLTGKVDRVDLLEGSNERVRVIDYKTSKPKTANQILGKTKDGDRDYFRQLVFYKLLGDTAGYFPYKIVECELDFVMPNDRGEFKKERFAIASSDLKELKEEIRKVWKDIHEQKFPCCEGGKECDGRYGKCEYWEMCGRS